MTDGKRQGPTPLAHRRHHLRYPSPSSSFRGIIVFASHECGITLRLSTTRYYYYFLIVAISCSSSAAMPCHPYWLSVYSVRRICSLHRTSYFCLARHEFLHQRLYMSISTISVMAFLTIFWHICFEIISSIKVSWKFPGFIGYPASSEEHYAIFSDVWGIGT